MFCPVSLLPVVAHVFASLKGLVLYENCSNALGDSLFSPALLSQSRMLYFWLSEHTLHSLASAAFLDERLALTIQGERLQVTVAGVVPSPHPLCSGEGVKLPLLFGESWFQ